MSNEHVRLSFSSSIDLYGPSAPWVIHTWHEHDVLPSTNPTDHFEICMYSYLVLISMFHPHHVVREWPSHKPAAGSRFGSNRGGYEAPRLGLYHRHL